MTDIAAIKERLAKARGKPKDWPKDWAEFIAHSREDIEALLNENERLEEALRHIAEQRTILIANPYSSFVRQALDHEARPSQVMS